MVPESTSNILNNLTQLLLEDLSPHSISFRFNRIALLLNDAKLPIENKECKEYYDDHDLSLILGIKNEALANGQFEQASKFHLIELELLVEKGQNKFTELKIEPHFFEYKNNCLIFHFNRRKENQRLIANLIEGYNLGHKKSNSHKLLYC